MAKVEEPTVARSKKPAVIVRSFGPSILLLLLSVSLADPGIIAGSKTVCKSKMNNTDREDRARIGIKQTKTNVNLILTS